MIERKKELHNADEGVEEFTVHFFATFLQVQKFQMKRQIIPMPSGTQLDLSLLFERLVIETKQFSLRQALHVEMLFKNVQMAPF